MTAIPFRKTPQSRAADDHQHAQRDNVSAHETEWVETPTSVQIMGALEYARATPSIAVVFGGVGCSKTSAARHYAKSFSWPSKGRVHYVYASQFRRSPTAILHAIAVKVFPDFVGAYRSYQIVEEILGALGPGSLIIVDEAQHLETEALEGVRSFLDEGGIGLAFLGNAVLDARIAGKGRHAAFAQMHSRVGMRLHVGRPSDDDIKAVLDAWRISGRREREYAGQIAGGSGGIRQLRKVLDQARLAATELNRPLDFNLMTKAVEMLGLAD